MGKNKKNRSKNKKKVIKYYTRKERHQKVTNILLQVAMEDMNHVLDEETRNGMFKWIEEGGDYIKDIQLPQYTRTMQIRLHDNKSLETFVCLKYNHVISDDKSVNAISQ